MATKKRWVDGAGYMQTDPKLERFLRDAVKLMKKHELFLGPTVRSGLMVYTWDEDDEAAIMDASVHEAILLKRKK